MSQGTQSYPSHLADLTVTSVRDLTVGYDSSNPPSFKPTLPVSSGNMITFGAEDKTTGQEVVLTIRYDRGPAFVEERLRTNVDFCLSEQVARNQRSRYPHPKFPTFLTFDTDQVLLGGAREGRYVANCVTWESGSGSQGGFVGSHEKRPVTPCLTYHIGVVPSARSMLF